MRLCLAILALLALLAPTRADDHFESKIRPVLADSCFQCHGAKKVSGGLRVDSRAALLRGGDSGPALVPGDPDASLLLKALRHDEGVKPMPPKTPRDTARVAAFSAWIKAGAKWPAAGPAFKGERHWAFEPIKPLTPPPGPSPIDGFLLRPLKKKGYMPLGKADRRTLIRRATYGLTGLPPTPREVGAFLADTRPDAYPRLIDRLLASPSHGERWGRHWLDVVRYADTAGENSDHPLPHAWRYRNWVIDALNADRPYDEFIQEQVAGDLMPEKTPARIVATGYLAIARRFGHEIDKEMHLTLEDAIDTLGKSVLGLSIGCARCHTHKYDPITAEDYYALYGILASTRFPFPGCEPQQLPRDLVPLPGGERDTGPLRERIASAYAAFKKLEDEQEKEAKARKGTPAAVLAKGEIADGGKTAFAVREAFKVRKGELVMLSVTPLRDHGADSTLVDFTIREAGKAGKTWDLKADTLNAFSKGNPIGPWHFLDARDGLRLLPDLATNFLGHKGLHVWRNGDTPSVFANTTEATIPVWTRLAPRSVFMHPGPADAVSVGWLSPIDGSVTVEGRLEDVHTGGTDGVGYWLQHFKADMTSLQRSAERTRKMRQLADDRRKLDAQLTAVPVAYAVAEGTAKDVRLHQRGDPDKPGKEVPRRWLSLFGGKPVPAKSGSGRLQLAGWLIDNPLAARVMVNRVWQHHFGRGLVPTPNDFGTRGTPPTHPELLDWLAADFIRSGWSIKHLHRRIMLSEAYQRSSTGKPVEADPSNEYLWRFSPRRMSAEELRDSLLALGGTLDRSPGRSHPFPLEATWNYTQHMPFSATYETDRRGVYLMTLRNRRHPFLGLFDGPDPNASTPGRQVTTVPTQALYFMNDPFYHRQAAAFAARWMALKDDETRISEAYRLGLQRSPTEREKERASKFVARYLASLDDVPAFDRPRQAWAAFARVLLAGNEFLYLD